MSNFEMLMETENTLPIAEQVFKDSCYDLLENLDEESMQKIEEYVTLLSDKKTKKSLETEISEALLPILERNAVLYGSFLYETQPIQESANLDKPILVSIRENSSADYIANVFIEQAQRRMSRNGKRAGMIGAGIGAAGAAGAGGYKYGKGEGLRKGIEQTKDSSTYQAGKELQGVGDRWNDLVSQSGKAAGKGLSAAKELSKSARNAGQDYVDMGG